MKANEKQIICFIIHAMNPRGAEVNAVDEDIVVSEFEPQSSYYVHFQSNDLQKNLKFLYPTTMG